MFDIENESTKIEDDDYKISLSDVFRTPKNTTSNHDPFSTLNRFPPNQNYNRFTTLNQNYNNSLANSNKPSYLYSDRFNSIQPINSAIAINKRNEHIMRKKSYNLQQQRTTLKKTLINDPFWGIFSETKPIKSAQKLNETINIPETLSVQKIIEKIEKKTHDQPPTTSLYDKIRLKTEKKTAELTELNRLFDKIEKEKTNFSIRLAYDNPFDTIESTNPRDLNSTPHAYLNLDLHNKSSPNEKIIEIEDRISLNPTPDSYNSLEHPSHVNIYAELKNTSDNKNLNNKRNRKTFSNMPRTKRPFEFFESNPINEIAIEPAAFQLENNNNSNNSNKKDNIYEIDKLVHNFESNLNTDSFVLKKLNLKKPLHTLFSNNKRMSSIRTLNGRANLKFNSKIGREFKNCIITDVKIGEGEFSETFQGYRYDENDPIKIAAKRLKKLKEKGENIVNLLSEISVLSQLGSHPNVIEYLGIHTFESNIYMVFEFAEKGDLKKQLELFRKTYKSETNNTPLNKIKWAYEIANGMEYISSLDIVHKDLAARNILLDKDFNCKIADFGCCKSDFMTRRPIRWMAPESINKLLFTTASDVWSYAVVLWEIWTYGMTPYPGMTDDEVINRISRWYRLYRPSDCPDDIYSLMQSCWKEYSKARPRFPYIKKKLKELFDSQFDQN